MKIVNQIIRCATIIPYFCGFILAEKWWGVILSAVLVFTWLLPRRHQPRWLQSTRLAGFAGIAAGGILDGVSPIILIAGVALALACWELEDQLPAGIKSSDMTAYSKNHLTRLALTLLAGLAAAEAGLLLSFHLPFGVIFLITIIVFVSIYRLYSLCKKPLNFAEPIEQKQK